MKKLIPILSVVCLMFVVSQQTFSQTLPDSLTIYYGYLKDFPLSSSSLKVLDTTLYEFHINDELYKHGNFYNVTSNTGHAHRSLIFTPNLKSGYYYNYDGFESYLQSTDNTKLFSSDKPYFNLFYSQAPGSERDESYFNAEHNQNLGKTISFGFNFNFLKNDGFYTRQTAKNANFNSNFRFHTRDYRYGFLVAYYHTRLNVMENGGIKNDTDFTENIEKNRKTINVNLSAASNFIKRGGWHFHQYFKLFKADSTRKENFLQLQHSISYIRDRNIYNDTKPNLDFYEHFYTNDNSAIFDSTVFKSVKNNFAFTNFDNNNNSKFQFEVGADIDFHNITYHTFANKVNISGEGVYITTSQEGIDKSKVYNIIPYGKFSIKFAGFSLIPEAHFSFGNYNNGDYNISGLINYDYKKFSFEGKYTSAATDVPWMYTHISTTNTVWENSFKKVFYNQAEIAARYNGLKLGAKYMLLNNYSYLDQNISPQQHEGAVSYLTAYFSAIYDLKRFEISGSFVYQFVSNKEIVRVPDFTGKITFIYKQPLFKRALFAQIGFDVIYNTPFYAEAYLPSLHSFYLQDEIKTGNYPYLNAYIRLQVKRARIFVEFVNVAEGLLGHNYIGVPHYPLNDRQFKFGVSWYFHD
ncbi:putative porin [Bacteroidales bacterium OttesenSCG-928-K03]|nr:putative porin [Odoribacter sp. OttesenSCG-928-L07]MDL2242697.1 putative porin [Bacteroidales bacterium OttesenSCG-928-K03]